MAVREKGVFLLVLETGVKVVEVVCDFIDSWYGFGTVDESGRRGGDLKSGERQLGFCK